MLMTAEDYLDEILNRENVNYSANSLVLSSVNKNLIPSIQTWAESLLNGIYLSGSFAKGTANKSNTDMDLFISLSNRTSESLKEIYESLFAAMKASGYSPRRQNVSIKVGVSEFNVDLIPAKQQILGSEDHSLIL